MSANRPRAADAEGPLETATQFDFRADLDGRVSWVKAANAVRGRRLREQFDAIAWPAGN